MTPEAFIEERLARLREDPPESHDAQEWELLTNPFLPALLAAAVADATTLRAQIEALTRYATNGEVIHYRGDWGEFVLRDDVLALLTEAEGAEDQRFCPHCGFTLIVPAKNVASSPQDTTKGPHEVPSSPDGAVRALAGNSAAENAVTDPTDAEWMAIVDFNGAWERLQHAVERYGKRVSREAYARGRLRGDKTTPPASASGAQDALLAITGFVNAYHNDGTTLTAAETLQAIASVLGKPMPPSAGGAKG